MLSVVGQAANQERTFLEQATPLITLAVGVLAFVGVWLGHWLTRRSWLREQRLRTYVEFLEVDHEIWLAATSLLKPNAERAQLFAKLDEQQSVLSRLLHTIAILGPDRVREAANRVSTAHSSLVKSLRDDVTLDLGQQERLDLRETTEGIEAGDAGYAFVRAASRVVR